jgi:hypothetical protein
MHHHPGSHYSLDRLSKLQRAEALRNAERRQLAKAALPQDRMRTTAAATLRRLADRVAPLTPEAPVAGGC